MMILKKAYFTNIGPFWNKNEITFEPDITAITGRNDAGKSFLLGLIAQLLSRDERSAVNEDQVSLAHRLNPTKFWQDDSSIGARIVFHATTDQGGGEITGVFKLAPKNWNVSWSGQFQVNGGNRRNAENSSDQLRGWPKAVVIDANSPDTIRTKIPLDEMHPIERALVRIAFGNDIDATEFVALTNLQRRRALQRAQDRLNRGWRNFSRLRCDMNSCLNHLPMMNAS